MTRSLVFQWQVKKEKIHNREFMVTDSFEGYAACVSGSSEVKKSRVQEQYIPKGWSDDEIPEGENEWDG